MVTGPGVLLREKIAALEGGPWYGRAELSELLGCPPTSIWSAAQNPNYPHLYPTAGIHFRGRQVHLWTAEQLRQFREHFAREHSTGRPRMWDVVEGRERARRFSLARYYETRATNALAAGEKEEAEHAAAEARQLRAGLEAQLIKRREELEGAARVGDE